MRSTVYLPLLASLACAGPLALEPRQDMPFDAIIAAPDPTIFTLTANAPQTRVKYNLAAATKSAIAAPLVERDVETVLVRPDPDAEMVERDEEPVLVKRGACSSEPAGKGPLVNNPDTSAAFTALTAFTVAATGAIAPPGYIQTFSNFRGSNSAYGYMGYTELSGYDVASCATQCNGITGCSGINIYYERDPSQNPGAGCENPPSVTRIKCVFWGGWIGPENASNIGQRRANFDVVITGSNGYMKTTVPTISGFTGTYLGNAAINAPLNPRGEDTYLGSKILTQSFFDPNLCAVACTQMTAYNIAHAPTDGSVIKTCQFFNTYMTAVNGQTQGQVCNFYKQAWDKSYATNTGQIRGQDIYSISYSFIYSLATNAGTSITAAGVSV